MFLDVFNSLITIREEIANKKIIIFGASSGGKRVLFTLLQMLLKPDYFVDNGIKKKNDCYLEYKIFNPKVLLTENKNNIAVLVASVYDKEICQQLKTMGFKKGKHFYSVLFDSETDENVKKEAAKKATNEAAKLEKINAKRYKNCVFNSPVDNTATIGSDVWIGYHVFLQENISIGNHTKIGTFSLIGCDSKIGKYCSLAPNVAITPSQHPKYFLSTNTDMYPMYKDAYIERYKGKIYPGCKTIKNAKVNFLAKQAATIGNDVWIGQNAVVMDNVKVGDGTIIGSNAVVTHNVPPYAIVAGVPAKIISYRFPQEVITKLLKLKWWNMPEKLLTNLPSDINDCIEILNNRKRKIKKIIKKF